MFFRKKKSRRVLALGLDGVPHSLITRFADDGTMPFMGELAKSGKFHRMEVTRPEVSSVNWSSFMTGANPGVHGIFGFTDLKPNSYEMTFPSFPELKADTLWDELGRHGKRCFILNQPSCYPARPIPGALVSGFVAVDLGRAVTPREHLAPLQQIKYKIDVDSQGCQDDPDRLFVELDVCLRSREAASDYFLALEPWDYAEIVLTGTDRIQHFLWPSCEGCGTESERAKAYYHACDAYLRRVVKRFYGLHEPDGLFLLSDHGFTDIEQEFYLNVWLRQEGYLAFEKEPPDSYGDITSSSQAFAMDPGRIYIHRKGHFPKGQVEGDGPLEEIKSKLESLEVDGAKVFQLVTRRDDLYTGNETGKGPDLVCTPRRGIDIKGAIKKRELFAESRFTGMHTWDDAFFWSQESRNEPVQITDLRKIIVHHLVGGTG